MGRPAAADSARLSRERILETALELVEAHGVASLSMRRLAQELDVWPMSLYRYFQDKEALLDALAEAVADEIAVPRSKGSWRDQMRELLHRAREAFERHPGTLQRGLSEGAAGPAAARLARGGLPILEAAGFDSDEAALAWDALLSYTAGAATQPNFEYGLDRLLDGIELRLS